MSRGIFRPRQSVGRITANAGNRVFIAGGRGPGRFVAKPAPTLKQKAIALAILLSGGGPFVPPEEEGARDDV
jgi:hypothetical protein